MIVLELKETFQTIAEAAMLAPLPKAYRNTLQKQIIAMQNWIVQNDKDISRLEQLELDLSASDSSDDAVTSDESDA